MTTAQSFAGAAVPTTISTSVNSSATSIVLADATGWPDGSTGPFTAVLGRSTSSEEKVLCSSRSGTTLTVTRGYDGTTAVSHASGETIAHSISAVAMRQAVLGTSGAVISLMRTTSFSAGDISWDTEDSDPDALVSVPVTTITLTRSGVYVVSAAVGPVGASTSDRITFTFGASAKPYTAASIPCLGGAVMVRNPGTLKATLVGSGTPPNAGLLIAHIAPTN